MSGTSATILIFPRRRRTEGFTTQDLIALYRWREGGQRVEIGERVEELGQFAQIYEPGQSWAAWAIGREGETIRLWDCRTYADIGRFATVPDALDAVPGCQARCRSEDRPMAEVLLFRQPA